MARRKNRSIGNFVRKNFPALVEAIAHAQGSDQNSGADKLDAAADFLNRKIDIPLVPEYLEGLIFKVALSAVVEAAIHFWGEDAWFEQLLRAADMEDLLNRA